MSKYCWIFFQQDYLVNKQFHLLCKSFVRLLPSRICFFKYSTTLLSSSFDMPAARPVWWFWWAKGSGNWHKYCNFLLNSSYFTAFPSCFISSRYDLIFCFCSFCSSSFSVFFYFTKWKGQYYFGRKHDRTINFFCMRANFLDFKTQWSNDCWIFCALSSGPC